MSRPPAALEALHATPPAHAQVYNEQINDLQNPANTNLALRKPGEHVDIAGLTETLVGSAAEAVAILDAGDEHRRTGRTNMNERSSRSHSIFRMVRARGFCHAVW